MQPAFSDARAGPRAAIEAVMIGSSWQRCRVHFLRNLLAEVPNGSAEMVASAIRTINEEIKRRTAVVGVFPRFRRPARHQ